MSRDYDLLSTQKLKNLNEPDVDVIRTLDKRRTGIHNKHNFYPCDLLLHAEDVFVRKKFDELRCEMPGTPKSTFLMVFSPDGSKVASTHGNHNIYVTDVRSGKNIKTLVGHPRTPWCIAFHPTSNQILASGCLGGQVRIWDLSGGSEVWTSEIPTVIASIAFHPDDRLLVIATYNELYFWDWSKPEPFTHVATGNLKEKVRYVAFDKLGHKLITGISNSPQTRWERVRAPVPVPRQVDRSANPYRRRITPRLISNMPTTLSPTQSPQNNTNNNNREPLSAVPERERRITACYRNLVREYELLVHRYLQIYRPPTMIDQGTDPMEIELNSITGSNINPRPSTSGIQSNNLPSEIPTTSEDMSIQTTSNYDAPQSSLNSTERHVPAIPIRPLPRRIPFDINSEIVQSQNSVSTSRLSDSTDSTYNSLDQTRPIDLSRCPTSESSNVISNNQTLPNNGTSDSSLLQTPTPSSRYNSTSIYERTPELERNMLVLTPSEICSLRRSARNIRSTQTQENDYTIENQSSNSNIQNRNERRNSAPATTNYSASNSRQQLRRGESEINLPPSTTNITQTTVNNEDCDENLENTRHLNQSCSYGSNESNTSVVNNLVLANTSTCNNDPATINSQNPNCRKVLIISTNLEPNTSADNTTDNASEQMINTNSTDSTNSSYKKNIKSFTNLNAKRYEILKEIKSLTPNISQVEEPIPEVNSQTTEKYLNCSTTKESGNVSNSTQQIVAQAGEKCSQNLVTESNDDTPNINDNDPTPSTSGIHTNACENYDSSCPQGDSRIFLPKKENARFYEHPRKRLHPGFSKKSRRPIIDSSSDSSSSEDDGLTTKRLCTPRLSSLSSATPNINSSNSSTVKTPTLNENSNNKDSRRPVRPINFNQELELLVTDLLADNESTQNSSTSQNVTHNHLNCPGTSNTTDRICNRCGGNIEKNLSQSCTSTHDTNTISTTTNSNACPRSTGNTNTRTTNTTVYTSPGNPRSNRPGRFFSHRVSAFYPTRIQNLRPYSRLRRNSSYLSPIMRNRLRTLNTLHSSNRLSSTFALDEVINYSERVAPEEEPQEPPVGFHPFDPPPEFATINPENIGIGNMYSNIVQELESSLNDVRSIRASNRIGETSDMLSSFSERLESIMNQSNAILRNLRTSIDTLQPSDQNPISFPNNLESQQQLPPSRPAEPRVSFSDSSFYLREQRNTQTSETNFDTQETSNVLESSNPQVDLFSNHNAIASDHTYPLNSRNTQPTTNNMSPLMASLHLTVSHIQRQARLLRQQVESIERIDRAMLEVAQLQMMRQMFIEMQCYFRITPSNENRSAVSSVRQMMAGTRISDSSPYDSPNEESTNENAGSSVETGPSSNSNTTNIHQNSATQTRNPSRKTYPRCIFLMHRNFRRGSVGNILQRRCLSRERMMRRHLFRRSFTCRSLIPRTPIDLTTNRNTGNVSQLSSETLRSLTRRLENFLMEHGRHIGRVVEPNRINSTGTDKDEYIMMLRLNLCRTRILGQNAYSNSNIRRQTSNVTSDGSSRYSARDTLTSATEILSRYIMNGTNITPSLRLLIWNIMDLSLLLSEILLLQIVDSIPPPSGMNLDPERESLSARIDQMCSRMLQSRLSGHSQQLTRSLRLTRLAVRHASRALDQTYTARRNSMLPSSHNRDQRRELLEEINNCLRNIRRHGNATQMSDQRVESNTENLSRTEWYRTIHSLISRYRCSTLLEDAQPSTSGANTNSDNGELTETTQTTTASTNYTQASSDEDNDPYWYNNTLNNNNNNNNNNNSNTNTININSNNGTATLRNDRLRPLYRTNNVNLFNLLNNEESNSSTPRNRPWNVPTVQINDVPLSQYQPSWHPRFLANRQRLSERFSELRTFPVGGIFRPRFLHPPYAGNPFDTDFDESMREQIYDNDIMTPITPNHRIQVWEFSSGLIPNINNALKNVVVNECKIHNDASVDIASSGNILVTLLPSGGYLNGTNRLGVYSLEWETLGQCLYITSFEQNAVSVSLSPLSRHLVVGLASRRVSIMPGETWTMAKIFVLDEKQSACNQLAPIREVEQTRDPNYMSVNCIRWLPVSGQGLVYATNTGQLRILT